MKKVFPGLAAMWALAAGAPQAAAQPFVIEGGEFNFSGATLFYDFFKDGQDGIDFINVDGDLDCLGNPYAGLDFGRLGCGDAVVDNLIATYNNGQELESYWLFQYRSVGSVNGFQEWVDYQTCGFIPDYVPFEGGLLNHYEWASLGQVIPGTNADDNCESGTPFCPNSIDGAFTDVEGPWAVRAGDENAGIWDRNPTENGYGFNSVPSTSGFVSELATLSVECSPGNVQSLNTNYTSPDGKTVYGVGAAYVPIVYIANRGTGAQNVNLTDIQHLMIAGRFRSGENLQGVTRDVGSGTRNGIMNTSGIDPAWGRGDNVGGIAALTATTNVGPNTQPTNCGGSGISENSVEMRRLAIGYTGLAGNSRAASDAIGGRYEILNVKFDDRGGNAFVRPTIDTVLDNANPSTGYQLGGVGTFSTVGNINANRDPSELLYDGAAPPVVNDHAAKYLLNIVDSIFGFEECGFCFESELSPGQYLAVSFFLPAGVDALPNSLNPDQFISHVGQPTFSQTLQNYIRANNGLGIGSDTPAFGSTTVAGRVPIRNSLAGTGTTYSDGQVQLYRYFNEADAEVTIAGGQRLGTRNRVAGDFAFNSARDVNDIAPMIAAVQDPVTWAKAQASGPSGPDSFGNNQQGNQVCNCVIPEVIGDFNSDGNFDAEDIRYFADGLLIVGGKLNRQTAFTQVDAAFGGNYFDTVLATGVTYTNGASRADVAGNQASPGWKPTGHDGVVDAQDIDYVCANFGNWQDADTAPFIDLSADMNGDLLINAADVAAVLGILGTTAGDANLDGTVDDADCEIVTANLGTQGGWAEGDFDCDGMVTPSDAAMSCVSTDPAVTAINPPSGAIDARQPSNPDGSSPQKGFTTFTITFDGDAASVSAADFTVAVEDKNNVNTNPAFNVIPAGTSATLTITGAVPAVSRTEITYLPTGQVFVYGYLPADVSQDGTSAVPDVLALIDSLNGINVKPIFATDVDRSGIANAADVLREIDLLNGAGAFDSFNGVSLP